MMYDYEAGGTGEIDTEYGEVAKSKIASHHIKTSTTNALSLRGTQEKTAKFPELSNRYSQERRLRAGHFWFVGCVYQ
jgi:hypothetical protein